MPALLHTRWTAPNRSSVASRRCSTDSSNDTSVGTPITLARAGRQLAHGGVEQRFVDVGEDDLHALGEEPLAQRPPDATAATGDDGDLAPEVLHRSTVTLVDRYLVISADCHAGADLLDYRPYLESRYHDEFDDVGGDAS